MRLPLDTHALLWRLADDSQLGSQARHLIEDHLLIAQAIEEDATFISEDRNASRYPVRLVACSDAPSSPSPGSP